MAEADKDPAVLSPAAAPQDAGTAVTPASAMPAPAETIVAAPVVEAAAGAVAAEAAPASPAAAEAPKAEPTLLEKFDAENAPKPAAEAKPADGEKKPDAGVVEKPAEAKPAEAKPADAEAKPAEPAKVDPVAYEYALPETIKMDDALKGTFHTALDTFRADPTKGAQGLIDLHNQTMQQYADHLLSEQHRIFGETRKGWQKDVLADEEIGGAGHQTAMGAIARARDLLVPEKDRASFDDFLRITGAGDHPQFLKLLHQAARWIDEPQANAAPNNIQPPPNNGRAPGNRRGLIYDHPSSTKRT